MLPKKNRADTKAVEKIFKEGGFLNSPHLTFKFIFAKSSSAPKISFTVPKTISKKAVNRNLLRRRGYDALARHIAAFPRGISGVFIFKKSQKDISILEHEIKNILSKIN